MTELIARTGAWLLQATHPDMLAMKTVAAQRGWFEAVTAVARDIMPLSMFVLVLVLAVLAWEFWWQFRKVRDVLNRVYADINPVTRHAINIADNLDYITTSIRHDVQQVNATIASANRRLHQAVELTENRLNEFSALLQVVQQEAEQAFVSTAAAVRGVRTGAAALGELHDDADDFVEGENDGDDSESSRDAFENGRQWSAEGETARSTPSRPRLRSRRRRD